MFCCHTLHIIPFIPANWVESSLFQTTYAYILEQMTKMIVSSHTYFLPVKNLMDERNAMEESK